MERSSPSPADSLVGPARRAGVGLALLLLALVWASGVPAAPAAAQDPEPSEGAVAAPAAEESPAPAVTVERVVATPTRPGREVLCTLTVSLRNRGEETVSAFAFDVEVGGRALPVYRDQVFLQGIPPGETAEVRLYNFWSGETGRPAPAEGDLPVAVTLREAQWMKVSDEEGVEVWTPVGAVEGLPATATTTVALE